MAKLINKQIIEPEEYVYDIEVAGNHNYFAEGICVHNCKSPTSEQGKNLLKLKSKYKIGMTGTILMNNPTDLYVPLRFIEKDNSTFTNFKYYYCTFSGPFNNILTGFKNTRVLKDELEECSLRRTKDLLDLPPKTIINEVLDMNDTQQTFYDNIVNGIVSSVDKVNITTSSLLAMVTRLRQATECPMYLTTEKIESQKVIRACQIAQETIENGSKIVIFTTFKDSAEDIYNRLKDYNPLLCTGDTKEVDINKNIELFQTNPLYKIMVATYSKMGTGVTLTAADTMVFVSTPWTNAIYTQAQDRIYRIGTERPVFIYHLLCKGTIDERVLEIINDKSAISDYFVDDKVSQQTINSLRKYIEEL